VGFSVDLAASRNLLPAVVAQGAALLMRADRIGGHRQRISESQAPACTYGDQLRTLQPQCLRPWSTITTAQSGRLR
jgi:hypothetical protein